MSTVRAVHEAALKYLNLSVKREINCIGESLDPPLDFSWGHLSQYSTLFYFISLTAGHNLKSKQKGER